MLNLLDIFDQHEDILQSSSSISFIGKQIRKLICPICLTSCFFTEFAKEKIICPTCKSEIELNEFVSDFVKYYYPRIDKDIYATCFHKANKSVDCYLCDCDKTIKLYYCSKCKNYDLNISGTFFDFKSDNKIDIKSGGTVRIIEYEDFEYKIYDDGPKTNIELRIQKGLNSKKPIIVLFKGETFIDCLGSTSDFPVIHVRIHSPVGFYEENTEEPNFYFYLNKIVVPYYFTDNYVFALSYLDKFSSITTKSKINTLVFKRKHFEKYKKPIIIPTDFDLNTYLKSIEEQIKKRKYIDIIIEESNKAFCQKENKIPYGIQFTNNKLSSICYFPD